MENAIAMVGVLRKKAGLLRKKEARFFMLTNNGELFYGKGVKVDYDACKFYLALQASTTILLPGNSPGDPLSLTIRIAFRGKPAMDLDAQNEEEKRMWAEAMMEVVELLKEINGDMAVAMPRPLYPWVLPTGEGWYMDPMGRMVLYELNEASMWMVADKREYDEIVLATWLEGPHTQKGRGTPRPIRSVPAQGSSTPQPLRSPNGEKANYIGEGAGGGFNPKGGVGVHQHHHHSRQRPSLSASGSGGRVWHAQHTSVPDSHSRSPVYRGDDSEAAHEAGPGSRVQWGGGQQGGGGGVSSVVREGAHETAPSYQAGRDGRGGGGSGGGDTRGPQGRSRRVGAVGVGGEGGRLVGSTAVLSSVFVVSPEEAESESLILRRTSRKGSHSSGRCGSRGEEGFEGEQPQEGGERGKVGEALGGSAGMLEGISPAMAILRESCSA